MDAEARGGEASGDRRLTGGERREPQRLWASIRADDPVPTWRLQTMDGLGSKCCERWVARLFYGASLLPTEVWW